MSVQTKECLAPGNTEVPDVVTTAWRPTDHALRGYVAGCIITGWDFDHADYGRRMTHEDFEMFKKRYLR